MVVDALMIGFVLVIGFGCDALAACGLWCLCGWGWLGLLLSSVWLRVGLL